MTRPKIGQREKKSRILHAATFPGDLPRFELFIAVVIGGVVAIAISPEFGAVIWAIGALIAVNEARHEARLSERFETVDKLADVFDLSESCQVSELSNVIATYMAIPEPELARVKNGVISIARDELVKLSTEKSSGELPSGEYYSWLLPMLDDAPSGSKVLALSMMMDCEWDESEPERRFIEKNEAAAERGVTVERIFVATADVMAQALEESPAVQAHLAETQPTGLCGFFVDMNYLEQSDAALLSKLGDGFIDLDGRVALIDLHSVDGTARGKVTMKDATLSTLQDIHDQLSVHARELTTSLRSDLQRVQKQE